MTDEFKLLLIAAIVVAFLIGLVVGRLSPNKKQAVNSQKELDDYKQAVNAHFAQTADLVDNLTDSYKAVFDHLGDSAKHLLNKEEIDKLLESRQHKTTTLNYLSEKKSEITIEEVTPTQEEEPKISGEPDDLNSDSDNKKTETNTSESIDIDNPDSHKKD